ncbi:hypothetical protein DYB32_008801 [Aphanomyces invadans]|uniref:TLC domain-containing protein n=1 Tax=Aphanomyces invadans TaxID=157072 RepID=A0A418AK31_9STRA|nr:hypothetical protein DYB32_008801 [Aphanomyces invadans]
MDALGATPAAAPSVGPSLVFLTYGVTGMSLVVFAVVFWLTHVVSLRHVTIYKGYTTVERANWCSRIPFVIYNFSGSCLADTYLLSIYLLVEICVVPMNVATFLEDLGYAHTHVHMGMSFASYGLWIVARGILPLYALYILWAVMIPSLTLHDTTDWVCAMPAIVCGHVISGFCVGCLIWIITPAFFATLKAKESSSSTQVRVTESTRYGTINPV